MIHETCYNTWNMLSHMGHTITPGTSYETWDMLWHLRPAMTQGHTVVPGTDAIWGTWHLKHISECKCHKYLVFIEPLKSTLHGNVNIGIKAFSNIHSPSYSTEPFMFQCSLVCSYVCWCFNNFVIDRYCPCHWHVHVHKIYGNIGNIIKGFQLGN